ncbi:hypothetical protein WSM22_36540 [Cytophagales bacterium WSM2-2]|nr:hypothetical protein WSM22_36540 [Cytophagales bacterium WSM2-2]
MMKAIPSVMLALLFTLMNCKYDDIGKLNCSALNLQIKIIAKTDADCGQSNASIHVSATGGTGNYTFTINDGAPQNDSTFLNLRAGSYVIKVKDNSCVAIVSEEIENKNGFNVSLAITQADCSSANGSIVVTPSGGVAPVTFSLNQGDFTSATTFNNLTPGAHTLIARDGTGCETTKQVQLTSKVSFANDVSQIISTNCAVAGCHVGPQLPDFRAFKTVQGFASAIKSETASRSMPIGKTLTQQEIDLIACWVNDAAPDN